MIRVLVIDDSAYSRRAIKSMLESSGRIEVVGVVMDGETGLRAVAQLHPDVITLDLEMPGLNGFAFLKILMKRMPKPVIVVSSWAGREDVLRALELGALDFVAKPSKSVSPALMEIQDELVLKVAEASTARMEVYAKDRPTDVTGFFTLPEVAASAAAPADPSTVAPADASPADRAGRRSPPPSRSPSLRRVPTPSAFSDPLDSPRLRGKSMTGAYRLLAEEELSGAGSPARAQAGTATGRARVRARVRTPSSPGLVSLPAVEEKPVGGLAPAEGVVVVGASTGGPRAIRKILAGLDHPLPWPMVIVQHMPPRFTNEFARRLRRKLSMDVREAVDGRRLAPGCVLVAPGGLHTEIDISASDRVPFIRLRVPEPGDRYIPSVDRLFTSASRVFEAGVVGVVLTGMGNDGAEGVCAVRWAGGRVIAEDESTAVVFGMPREAVSTGLVESVVPLPDIASAIVRMIGLQS